MLPEFLLTTEEMLPESPPAFILTAGKARDGTHIRLWGVMAGRSHTSHST